METLTPTPEVKVFSWSNLSQKIKNIDTTKQKIFIVLESILSIILHAFLLGVLFIMAIGSKEGSDANIVFLAFSAVVVLSYFLVFIIQLMSLKYFETRLKYILILFILPGFLILSIFIYFFFLRYFILWLLSSLF